MKLVVIASVTAVAVLGGCANRGPAFRGDPPEGFTRNQYAQYVADKTTSPDLTPEEWLLNKKASAKNSRDLHGGGFHGGLNF